ncbi:MAG TPA: hypothetical protein VFF28_04700 [Candidatus Nanoarchaeia archaeon]|nr:hypothetical protein [Candidatus Nanoarchaeia archaeon]
MIDKTLINTLSKLAKGEKKIKGFRNRARVKGQIVNKGKTKNGNIRLKLKKGEDIYNFVVIKSHKERFGLAQKLKVGDLVSAQGVSRFRAVICTQLKQIKNIDESKQVQLEGFS